MYMHAPSGRTAPLEQLVHPPQLHHADPGHRPFELIDWARPSYGSKRNHPIGRDAARLARRVRAPNHLPAASPIRGPAPSHVSTAPSQMPSEPGATDRARPSYPRATDRRSLRRETDGECTRHSRRGRDPTKMTKPSPRGGWTGGNSDDLLVMLLAS